MKKYPSGNWQAFGRIVHHARLSAGFTDTQEWADKVGRSSRMLLGLERGEPVGSGTLDRVAVALGWAPDAPYRGLENPQSFEAVGVPTETVRPDVHDPDVATIKARKPANMGDEEFKRLLAEYEEEIEWKLDRAARER